MIPRLPFGSSATEIALRAYIDHPIVLYGHHEDVAAGLDVLAEAAARVNRLGDVRWTSLEEIARGNAGVLRDGDAVSLRAYSHTVRIPEGAELADASRLPTAITRFRGWSFAGEREIHPFDRPVDVAEGARSRSGCVCGSSAIPPRSRPPRRRVWPRCAGSPPSRATGWSPYGPEAFGARPGFDAPTPGASSRRGARAMRQPDAASRLRPASVCATHGPVAMVPTRSGEMVFACAVGCH